MNDRISSGRGLVGARLIYFTVDLFYSRSRVALTSSCNYIRLVRTNRIRLTAPRPICSAQIAGKFSEIRATPIAPQVRHQRGREDREGHVQRAMPGDLPVPEQAVPAEAERVPPVRRRGAFRSRGAAH